MPDVLASVAEYYAAKLAAHGQSAQGVDWNSPEGQRLRFEQLLRVVIPSVAYTINDLGCGYGALVDFLDARGDDFAYRGYDVSDAMVTAARARFARRANVSFTTGSEPEAADYGVASGIFNVRLKADEAQWHEHVLRTLDALDRSSRRGFAFNCLTAYSDPDRMRDDLFYADPCWLFDYCKQRHSRHVALLHDYGLYEFTIVVRRDL